LRKEVDSAPRSTLKHQHNRTIEIEILHRAQRSLADPKFARTIKIKNAIISVP
jgi:DNA-binding transcriptional regulator YiaG